MNNLIIFSGFHLGNFLERTISQRGDPNHKNHAQVLVQHRRIMKNGIEKISFSFKSCLILVTGEMEALPSNIYFL